MKKVLFILLIIFSFQVVAQEKLPLKDFAQKSKFKSFKISPDGKHIAFTYDDDKSNQDRLAVMDLANKKIKVSFNSDGPDREIIQFFWATNERILMLNQKVTGWLDGQDKEYRLVGGNIDGKKRVELWDFQRAGVTLISTLDDDPDHVLVGKSHFSDAGGVKLNRMNIFTGDMKYVIDSPKTIGTSESRIFGISVDTNDVPRVAFEYDRVDVDDDEDDVSYLHYKADTEWKVLPLPTKGGFSPALNSVGFNKDNSKIYFTSNHDLDYEGTTGLFELDLSSEQVKFIFRHPDVDIGGGVSGPDGELIAVSYDAGYRDYYYLQDAEVADEVTFHKSLRASFKNQNVGISSYSDDGLMATVTVYSDKNPGDFYTFNRATSKAKYISSSMPHIKPEQMSAVEPFIMTARDGLKMYGQMTIPNGKELKNLPLIIYPHGGPYRAADTWRWDNRAQMLANNGYLVVQLNFRGSGGYGENFYEAGKGEWGGKMQDDLTDVTKWAIQKGYADANRVCIHGVSYGGYAALQAVVKEPDLYQCSIPDAGVYEIRLQWTKADSFKTNRKAGERYIQWMLGDNDPETVKAASPAHHLDKVKAALFLVHGSEDVRVPIANAYFVEEQLKALGKPYEKLYKKDGHGFQKIKYRVELYDRMLKFLDENIGEKSVSVQ